MTKFELKTIKVPDPIESSYLIIKKSGAKKNILLLHGFGETAEYFYSKMESLMPEDSNILAVNGPFFVPVLSKGKYRHGHSWYFYDLEKDHYIVEMSIAINYILKIFEIENILSLPLTIVGYSQGGYLAPFVGAKFSTTQKVIGINCQFLDEEIELPRFKLIGIHGENDEIVDYRNSKKSMEKLIKNGAQGEYHVIPDQNHRLNLEFVEIIKKITQGL